MHLLAGQPGFPAASLECAADKIFGQDLLGPHPVTGAKEKRQIQADSQEKLVLGTHSTYRWGGIQIPQLSYTPSGDAGVHSQLLRQSSPKVYHLALKI